MNNINTALQELAAARGASLGQEPHLRSRSGVSFVSTNDSRGSREARDSGEGVELGSRSHTGGSMERSQLSPSLMQRIQKVKQNSLTPSTSQARELSGWGSGIPNAAQVCALSIVTARISFAFALQSALMCTTIIAGIRPHVGP